MNKLNSFIFLIALVINNFNVALALDYPIQAALDDHRQLSKLGNYDFSKEYFKLLFLTPPSGYRYAVVNKEKSVYTKKKRKKKTPFSIKDDDLDELKFWDYKQPVVNVWLTPQPQTKNLVKFGRGLGYLTAGLFTVATFGIGMSTLSLPGKINGYKVSKDSVYAKLVSGKKIVCETQDKDIVLMTDLAQQYFFPDDHYRKFVNKLFLTKFVFEPNCFYDIEKLKLIVENDKHKKVFGFIIPKKTIEAIQKDFDYYFKEVQKDV
jgi:hypothetical protein